MTAIVSHWDRADARRWQSLLALAERSSLQQSWAYGAAVEAQGHVVRRLVVEVDGNPVCMAQLAMRRLAGRFGLTLLMRGPAWLDQASRALETEVLATIREACRGSVLLWSPDDVNVAGRRSGHRRVLSGYSTAWLDLQRPLAAIEAGLDGKWRNMLRQAERGGLELRAVRGGQLLDWLVDANEAYRARIGYRGPTPDFIKALGAHQAKTQRLALVALERREPVAGIIIDRHGQSATYYAGCTSPRGREMRAHHLLLWEAVRRLGAAGVANLDLGGIDTEKAPGVARFKLGMGSRPETLAGTYLVPPAFSSVRTAKGPRLPATPSDSLVQGAT